MPAARACSSSGRSRFFARLGADGLIGFGEAWMTGDMTTGGWHATGGERAAARPAGFEHRLRRWPTRRPTSSPPCSDVLCRRMSVLVPRSLQTLRHTWQNRPPADRGEHADRRPGEHPPALRPVQRPVRAVPRSDLTYSAAWFEPGDDLLTAQHRKIDGILDLARVQPGQRVLEIGSGWGGLAIRAVQERDVHVTTLTLSEAQKELAERRIAEAGLSHRIDVLLEDYRHHAGREVGTLRRDRQRGDDRGGRRAVLARLLRRRSTGCSPTAAG